MVTARNEFEAVPAYEHIAGCSLGTWTDREVCNEMLSVLDTVQSQVDVNALYKVLAGIPDSNSEFMHEMQDEIADHLNYYMPMAEFCSVLLHDSEWSVQPNIEMAQEECEILDEYPDEYRGDFILVINDHGNVTCQQWQPTFVNGPPEYVTIWAAV